VALDTSDWSPVWKFTTESGTGIDEMVSLSSVSVYPNPSNGSFTVQTNSLVNDEISIQVVDITGKIIYTEPVSLTIGKNSFDINLTGLSSGYYQVNLRKGNSVITKKLMIK
jgi:flagellar basal body rod protein FlgG